MPFRRSNTSRRRAVSLFAALLSVLSISGIAYAYWRTSGTGSALASTGTLNAATSVTVPGTSTGTVTVSWTPPASPGTGGTLRYYVQRMTGSTTDAACGTSVTVTITSTSCSDTGVTTGSYTYKVVTVFNSWSTTSTASGTVAVNTVLAPTVTLVAPANSAATNSARPVFTGTASGNSTVTIALYAGATTTGAPNASYSGTPTGTTSPYSFSITATATLPDGTYTTRASQTNTGGTGTSTSNTFLIDTGAPSPSISTVGTNNFTNSTTPTITGTASRQATDSTHSADSGTVSVAIYSGTATTGTPVQGPSSATVNSGTGTWTLTTSTLTANAQYTALVRQTDAAGNTGTSSRTFVVDTAPPSAPAPTVNGRS